MEFIGYIIDVIKSIWFSLIPFYVINEFEHGIILRLGKWYKDIYPGLGWKIPFFDEVLKCRNTVTTMSIQNQTLTTLDGEQITIEAIVKYKINNAKKYLLEVEDTTDAINDITQGKIKEIVTNKTWNEVRLLQDAEIKEAVSIETIKWGIKVYYITITSLAKARVYKLINDNA